MERVAEACGVTDIFPLSLSLFLSLAFSLLDRSKTALQNYAGTATLDRRKSAATFHRLPGFRSFPVAWSARLALLNFLQR